MVDRDTVMRAIAAQEALRGTLPEDVVDTAVAALRASLEVRPDEPRSEAVAPVERRRRLASVLFADVAGYTAMSETLDPEVVAGLMNDLWAVVDAVIGEHGGRVDKHIGDAVMGVWGVDGAREDDPERAVRAALALRTAFEEFRSAQGLDIDVRIGVNTGPVLFGRVGTAGELSVTGDAVNVANRLEHAAPHGSVLVSHDTYRHVHGFFDVRPQEPLAVRGKSAPLRTYVVERAKPRAFRLPTRGVEGIETRMVGRDAELRVLQDAFLDAIGHGRTRVVTVVGDAGAGKSRLLDEFTAWLELRPEMVRYLKGRSGPDLQTVPRGLLRELFAYRFEIFDDDPRADVVGKLRSGLVGLTDREADVVGHWLGFDLAQSAAVVDLVGSEQFGTVALAHLTRHLRRVLADTPAVLLVEDVHWADEDSLDAVVHLVEQIPRAALLVVCLARPTFAEGHHDWGAGPGSSTLVQLRALSAADTDGLVREILQRADQVPERLIRLVAEQSDGNPFYVEELVKMLIDDGVIVIRAEGPWEVDVGRLSGLTVPPTLSGVLQARLDGLLDVERTALQHSAVVGRIFWDDAVAALLSDSGLAATRESVAPTLARLDRKELVRPNERSTFSDAAEFKFKHALLRDVTYETVLLDDRRRLHAVAAAWLQARAADRLGEHLGPLAQHLSLAGEHLRAAQVLEQAAANAAATGAVRTAVRLYQRALDHRAEVDAEHTLEATRARLALTRLHELAGELAPASEHLEIASRDAASLGDHEVNARALLYRILSALDSGQWEMATDLVRRAEPIARMTGGEVMAELLMARALLTSATVGPDASLHVFHEALVESRAAGDVELEMKALGLLADCYRRLQRFEPAERLVHDALSIARRVGNRGREAQLMHNLGTNAHVKAGPGEPSELATAIQLYRDSLEILEDLGLGADAITAIGDLAQAEIEAGVLDDGARHAHEFLQRAHDSHLSGDQCFAVIIHGQIALATGDRAAGLRLIGAATADPRAPHRDDEIERVLRVHRIDPERAKPDLHAGSQLDLDTIVDQLLDQTGSRLASHPGRPDR